MSQWESCQWDGNTSPEFQARVEHSSRLRAKGGYIKLLRLRDDSLQAAGELPLYHVVSSFGANSDYSWSGCIVRNHNESIESLQERAVDYVFRVNRW